MRVQHPTPPAKSCAHDLPKRASAKYTAALASDRMMEQWHAPSPPQAEWLPAVGDRTVTASFQRLGVS